MSGCAVVGPGRRTVRAVLVVGAGSIGSSWAAHLLAHGLEVVVVDPVEASHASARRTVESYLAEGGLDGADLEEALSRLSTTTDLVAAAGRADLVVEAGPEVLSVKREIFAELDAATPADVLLTSSSSGIAPSSFADAAVRHPERVLVAHPFNPPHIVPLVELVGATSTSPEALAAAGAFFTGVGKRCITLHTELPGHVVNRLQAALWREAYDLVGRGAVTVADIDTAIAWGPGLRWALLGPFATQHLSGGDGGIAHILDHLGPPMEEWWQDLGAPELSPELVARIVRGMDEAMAGVGQTEDQLRARRDAALRALVAAKEEVGLP
ncbi:3-hydroxyacyl-CoA dehydrogenase family protein [Ornithinimicrobium sp. LYQ103]|uniref:3-hydroxyacyl-CoA dehydrogenase family protein n=1 Tax=Ornithinimicrobium sp. LYQ103 TaxID=3378796 RepID=UPI0038550EF6